MLSWASLVPKKDPGFSSCEDGADERFLGASDDLRKFLSGILLTMKGASPLRGDTALWLLGVWLLFGDVAAEAAAGACSVKGDKSRSSVSGWSESPFATGCGSDRLEAISGSDEASFIEQVLESSEDEGGKEDSRGEIQPSKQSKGLYVLRTGCCKSQRGFEKPWKEEIEEKERESRE